MPQDLIWFLASTWLPNPFLPENLLVAKVLFNISINLRIASLVFSPPVCFLFWYFQVASAFLSVVYLGFFPFALMKELDSPLGIGRFAFHVLKFGKKSVLVHWGSFNTRQNWEGIWAPFRSCGAISVQVLNRSELQESEDNIIGLRGCCQDLLREMMYIQFLAHINNTTY